jgi:hypothetical protein
VSYLNFLHSDMIINDKDKIYLHWLFPSKEVNYGQADIYAEVIHETSDDDDESNYEDELEEEDSDDEIDAITVPISIVGPSKLTQRKDVSGSSVLHKSPERSEGKNKSDKINKAS